MIMNRIRIIGIFILMLAVIAPEAALAEWQVYFTGQAQRMFGAGGRGSFSTRSQCEAYNPAWSRWHGVSVGRVDDTLTSLHRPSLDITWIEWWGTIQRSQVGFGFF